jgi:hypothetical protein
MASTKVPSELIANTAILGQHLHTTLGNTGVTANSSGLFIGQPVATSDTVQFQTVTGSHAGTIAAATTGTTQANTDNSAKMATTEFVTNKIQELIGGAPSTLNDLNELAAAINDDASYNSTLTTALATKAPIASPTFTGSGRMNGDWVVGAATGEDKFVVAPQAAGSGTFLISYNDAGNAYEPLTADFETLALRTSGTPRLSIDSSGNIALAGDLTTTGTIDGVDIATRDAILTSTTTTAGAALPKAGGTVTGNLRSASFSVGAADSGEALNILDGGHTGHGATNTVSLASFAENVSGNSSGPWLGSMTNENTAVIGSRTASGNIGFQTYDGGWGERMRITNTGSVGIGTTDQIGEKLTVNGSVQVLGNNDPNYSAKFISGYDSTHGLRITTRINDTSESEVLGVFANSGGAAPRLVLNPTNGWNVGIGLTSGISSKLHVNTEMSLGADGDNRAILGYTPSRFYIGTRQGGTNYFDTVSVTGGNVGIGDTTPSVKLDVYQSTVGIGAVDFRHVNGNRILLNPSYNYHDAYNHIFRGLNGTDTHVTIDNSGDVGIGVAPATHARLTLGGTTASYSSSLVFDNNTTGGAEFFMLASDNTWSAGANKFLMGHGSPSSSAVDIAIDADGNVGIGATSPSAKLELNVPTGDGLLINSADIATIKMKNTAGGVKNWGFATTNLAASDFGIYQSNSNGGDPITAGTARMYFAGNGNVGIGTTAPYGRLELKGNGNSWTTAPAIRMWDDLNSKGWLVGTANNITPGDFYIRTLPSISGTPGSSEQEFTIKHGTGNVGIGTSSPANRLHIDYSVSTSAANLAESKSVAAIAYYPLRNSSNYGMYFGNNGASSGYVQVTDGSSGSTMNINPYGGNVGIGTTTPSSRLHVVSGATRLQGGTVRINRHDNDCGLFLHSDAQSSHYNWMITTQDTVNEGIEFIPSTAVGGTTFSSPAMSIVASTGEMRAKSLLLEENSPIRFIANGSENTYMRSVIYAHQNNTGSNFNNGMHIEMGRISNSSSAEVRAFVVGARGGQSSFKVTERAAGVTQADGDYLVKMYDLNADGFIDLSTGQATPLVKTRITSYGTSFFTPAGTTATNIAAVSIGSETGARAGYLNIDSTGTSVAGGIRHRMGGGTQYLNVASTHTGSGTLPYWHIKTNIYYNQNVMFVARVHGYAYGNSGHIIDMQRSGYAYSGSSTSLVGSQFVNNGSGTVDTLVPYYTSAGQLCFRAFAGSSSYYTGMAFDIKMQSPTGYNHDFVVDVHNLNTTSGNYYT